MQVGRNYLLRLLEEILVYLRRIGMSLARISLLVLGLSLMSCGNKKDKDCIVGSEKRMMCQAEIVGNYYPSAPNEFEMEQCNRLYLEHGCY